MACAIEFGGTSLCRTRKALDQSFPGPRAFARGLHAGALAVLYVVLGGCTTLVSSVTEDLAEDLSSAILDNDDLDIVREGAPAYLIMLDALLRSDPDSPALLAAAAALNGAYGTSFVDDPERRRAFARKALELASRAACEEIPWTCTVRTDPVATLEERLPGLAQSDVPVAYAFATAWAGWIQANSDDWGAVAELGRVKSLMARIAELDEGYEHGGPRLYLGVFETLVPAALGGRPELGRAHFERAIELSEGRFLMARVLLAEHYGRLVFDRELHDRELRIALAAEPRQRGMTLANLIAQEQARGLLESADEYF